MAYEVEAVFKDQFAEGWYQNASQTVSKLLPLIDQSTIQGDDQYVDIISPVNVADGTKNAAFGAVSFTEVPMVQRRFDWLPLEITTGLKREQIDRMMKDPTSRIGQVHTQGMGRKFDKYIIAAFDKAFTDIDKDGTETAKSTIQSIAHGSTGFTIDKILEAINLFNNAEVMDGNRVCVCAPDDLSYLGKTVDSASKDYAEVMRLVTNETDRLWGIKFVTIGRGNDHSLAEAGTPLIRDTFFFDASGMTATVRAPRTLVEPRPDLTGETWQIKSLAEIGVARLEEAKVIKCGVDTTHVPA